MKAIKQYVPVVLFITLQKVVLTFESLDEILKCDHSNESYRAVYFPVQFMYNVVLAFGGYDASFKMKHYSIYKQNNNKYNNK